MATLVHFIAEGTGLNFCTVPHIPRELSAKLVAVIIWLAGCRYISIIRSEATYFTAILIRCLYFITVTLG